MRRVSLALVHHPIRGRHGETLTTTLTNLDLHDLARCARTYGLQALYIVHPLSSQRLLAERILRHWTEGPGGKRIPDRAEALSVVRIVSHLETITAGVEGASRNDGAEGAPRKVLGTSTELWTTAAVAQGDITTFSEARRRLAEAGPDVVIVFGTGWGLTAETLDAAAVRLEPIRAAADTGYNHLSVRAACAITLDRLLG